jgi:hypothetical protein
VVGPVEETAVELEVPEVGTEEGDELVEAVELDSEDAMVALVAGVVRLSLVAAWGRRMPTPIARTKATTTATVAPAAICLLYSDNRDLLCTRSI